MRGRAGFPRHIRREFWRLIAAGEQTEAAATAVGVSRTVSTRWFSQAGGMTPLALNDPSGRYLSITEREEIAVLSGHVSVREIGRRLGRSPSTISRELKRNAASDSKYRASSSGSGTTFSSRTRSSYLHRINPPCSWRNFCRSTPVGGRLRDPALRRQRDRFVRPRCRMTAGWTSACTPTARPGRTLTC